MKAEHEDHIIRTVAELETAYPKRPGELVIASEFDHLPPAYQAMVAASEFIVIGSCGARGLDASPYGGRPGFVRVEGDRTLYIADCAGNDRIDTLRNLIGDPRIGIMFFLRGLGSVLRARGTATVSADPALTGKFGKFGKPPAAVIVVQVNTAFLQCPKSAIRGKLWERFDAEEARDARAALPAVSGARPSSRRRA